MELMEDIKLVTIDVMDGILDSKKIVYQDLLWEEYRLISCVCNGDDYEVRYYHSMLR